MPTKRIATATGHSVIQTEHKLYEAVSPKKTIEGAYAGLIGSSIAAAIFTIIAFRPPLGLPEYSLGHRID